MGPSAGGIGGSGVGLAAVEVRGGIGSGWRSFLTSSCTETNGPSPRKPSTTA